MNEMEIGVSFNEKHSYYDFGLLLISYNFPMPKPKWNTVSVPGSDGSIDFSEVTGRLNYNNRDNIEMVFALDCSYEDWADKQSQLAACLHGPQVKVILDDDKRYYYNCRLEIAAEKESIATGQIVITGSGEPYKYDIRSSAEPWLWDTFSLRTGVIRTAKDIEITADNKTIRIRAGGLSVVPIFRVHASTNLAVTFDGKVYALPIGNNRFPQIRVAGDRDITLTFSGTGKLTVDYRARYL